MAGPLTAVLIFIEMQSPTRLMHARHAREVAAQAGLPRLADVPVACRLLKAGRSTVYELIAQRRLVAYRVGAGGGGLRVSVESIRAFLEEVKI